MTGRDRRLHHIWPGRPAELLGSQPRREAAKRLFPDGGRLPLTLTASQTFPNGVLQLVYAPA